MGTENLIILGTLFIFVFAISLIIFVVIQQKRTISTENKFNLKLSEVVINSQESERKRIGEELHDDIVSKLMASKLILDNLSLLSTNESKADIEEVISLILEISKEVRKISHILHPAALQEFGLDYAINDFCNILNKSHICQIEFNADIGNLT